VIAFGHDDRAAAALPGWAAGERGDLAALRCRRTPAASAPGRCHPDLRVCVTLPGLYWLDEVVECTRLEYALRFQNESHSEGRTIASCGNEGPSSESINPE
jgi:hypothetical protein